MTPPINIDGSTVGAITIDGTDVSEVTVDGSTVFSAIPDSVVSRPQDDSKKTISEQRGLNISSTVEWPDIGATISGSTSEATAAYCYRVSDGTLLSSTDISSLTAGDSFVLEGVDLQPDDGTDATKYNLVIDAEGSDYTQGFTSNVSVPIDSPDGQLTIEGLAVGSQQTFTSTPDLLNIVTVGNVGFN